MPPKLKGEHVLKALGELDGGAGHPFGAPTGYELVHGGKRYDPKAVVGLACPRPKQASNPLPLAR